jgi:hypothetical protein
VDYHEPFVKGNMGVFENGSDFHGELLPAGSALPNTGANMGLSSRLRGELVGLSEYPAMGADCSVRP